MGSAVSVVDEIENPDLRAKPVRPRLFLGESDDEALRVGRTVDLNGDAVVGIRGLGPRLGAFYAVGTGSVRLEDFPDREQQ